MEICAAGSFWTSGADDGDDSISLRAHQTRAAIRLRPNVATSGAALTCVSLPQASFGLHEVYLLKKWRIKGGAGTILALIFLCTVAAQVDQAQTQSLLRKD